MWPWIKDIHYEIISLNLKADLNTSSKQKNGAGGRGGEGGEGEGERN